MWYWSGKNSLSSISTTWCHCGLGQSGSLKHNAQVKLNNWVRVTIRQTFTFTTLMVLATPGWSANQPITSHNTEMYLNFFFFLLWVQKGSYTSWCLPQHSCSRSYWRWSPPAEPWGTPGVQNASTAEQSSGWHLSTTNKNMRYRGHLNTTAWAGSLLGSALAGAYFHLLSGQDLNQKFYVIIAPCMSPVSFKSVLQTADNLQWNVSHAQPYSGAKPSVAHINPGMAMCKCTVPHSAWTFLLVYMVTQD